MSSADAVRSTVYLSPELHRAIRLKAAYSRRSMSEFVNDALRQTLREDQEDLAAARSRAEEKGWGDEARLAKLKADRTL